MRAAAPTRRTTQEMNMSDALVARFFAAADTLDPDRFCAELPDDIVWRFGNAPPAHGIAAVRAQYSGFIGMLSAMRHTVVGVWRSEGCLTVETSVVYTDRHGREICCPGCDIMLLEGGRLKEIRIFVDNHALNPGVAM
jgi:ketosteroid isomerase-like protein